MENVDPLVMTNTGKKWKPRKPMAHLLYSLMRTIIKNDDFAAKRCDFPGAVQVLNG